MEYCPQCGNEWDGEYCHRCDYPCCYETPEDHPLYHDIMTDLEYVSKTY